MKKRIINFAYGVSVVVVGNLVYDLLANVYNDHVHDVEDLKERGVEAAKAAQEAFNDTEGEV